MWLPKPLLSPYTHKLLSSLEIFLDCLPKLEPFVYTDRGRRESKDDDTEGLARLFKLGGREDRQS